MIVLFIPTIVTGSKVEEFVYAEKSTQHERLSNHHRGCYQFSKGKQKTIHARFSLSYAPLFPEILTEMRLELSPLALTGIIRKEKVQ